MHQRNYNILAGLLSGSALLVATPAEALLYRYDFVSGPGSTTGPLTFVTTVGNNGDQYSGAIFGSFTVDTENPTAPITDFDIELNPAIITRVQQGQAVQIFIPSDNQPGPLPVTQLQLINSGSDGTLFNALRFSFADPTGNLNQGYSGTGANNEIPTCTSQVSINTGLGCGFGQISFQSNLLAPTLPPNSTNPGYIDALLDSPTTGDTLFCYAPSQGVGNEGCAQNGAAVVDGSSPGDPFFPSGLTGGLNGTLVPSPFSFLGIAPLLGVKRLRSRYTISASKK
jgi:hypothetical protein